MAHTHITTNKRNFKHLTLAERGKIEALRAMGKSMQEIANQVGKHKSTI